MYWNEEVYIGMKRGRGCIGMKRGRGCIGMKRYILE